MDKKYHGHVTTSDGRHIPLSAENAKELWELVEQRAAERASKYPDDSSAIAAMLEAYQRLQEMGWKEAQYCPKDGSVFEVIEPGSGAIHKCTYHGNWPDGTYYIHSDGDLWPSRPVLFRLINKGK